MELTVKQENLSKALNIISKIASERTSLPILSNVLLRTNGSRLLIAATDLEYFIVPMADYEKYSIRNPKQLLYVCQKLSKILKFQELRLRNAMISKASDRVVQVLALLYWDLCQREQQDSLPFEIHIQEISRLAATTRETASHVIKRLKQDKRIAYSHKKLTYLDIDFFLENLTETH